VTLEEVNLNWAKIRHAIRTENRQVEALVNSSMVQGIEAGNRLVLEFASDFLSSKLEKEENKCIVEQALASILGKPCRVRATVRGAAPTAPASLSSVGAPPSLAAAGPPPSASAGAEPAAPAPAVPQSEKTAGDAEPAAQVDPYEDAASDPVIQDLVSLGGRVTDVQVLPEE
jgi:hypothetical protein